MTMFTVSRGRQLVVMVALALGLLACGRDGAGMVADAMVDAAEMLRDAGGSDASAQTHEYAATCTVIGTRTTTFPSSGETLTVETYAADLPDSLVDPDTVLNAVGIACGHVVRTDTPSCVAPDCTDTNPPPLDCMTVPASLELHHIRVGCGYQTTVDPDGAGPMPPTTNADHYTTVRVVTF